MDSNTFKAAIWELAMYFERKLPGDETIRQWCDEVTSIPNRYAPTLISAAKKLEAWPRNLPAWWSMKANEIAETQGDNKAYYIHPRRFYPAHYAKGDCPKCQGKGLYDFHMDWPVHKDQDGKVITKHIVRPALCECTEAAEYGF